MKSQPESKIDAIRHSLAHLLAMAALKKFPDAKLGIGPAIENGFYYDFFLPQGEESKKLRVKSKDKKENEKITEDMLPEIEKEMRRLAKENLQFSGEKVTPQKARRLFKNQSFKLELIRDFAKDGKQLTIYRTANTFGKDKIPLHPPLLKGGTLLPLKKGGREGFSEKQDTFTDLC